MTFNHGRFGCFVNYKLSGVWVRIRAWGLNPAAVVLFYNQTRFKIYMRF